jgi:arginine deiminase
MDEFIGTTYSRILLFLDPLPYMFFTRAKKKGDTNGVSFFFEKKNRETPIHRYQHRFVE